jgi:hypothetical protein
MVLTREDGPFVFLRFWLIRTLKLDHEAPGALPMGLYKILMYCPACHAGQVSFWWMVGMGARLPSTYFITVTLTIFFAKTLEAFAAKAWN